MVAVEHDFIVEKGADWVIALSLTDSASVAVDHTGYTVEMDVRNSWNSSTELLSLTTANSRITINGSGNIVLTLSDSLTASLTFDRGVYDLKSTSPAGVVNYYLRGNFIVKQTATR